jgi:hypothetical protein
VIEIGAWFLVLSLVVWLMIPSAPKAHDSSAQGNALGLGPSRSSAPTVRDILARRTTPGHIAALQAADPLAVPTQHFLFPADSLPGA